MLKRAAAVLAAIMLFSSVVFAADGDASEYTEPTDEEKAMLAEIVGNSFLITQNFGDGVAPRDGDVFDYLLTIGEFGAGGAFAEYCTSKDGYVVEFSIPYDLFMKTVEKHFAIYPDMKEYFGEDYNEADNTIHTMFVWDVRYGISMETECFVRVRDKNEYHVIGVAVDPNFGDPVTDNMKPHDDYFPLIDEDGRMIPCYVNDCFDMIFEKDGDRFRFAGKRSLDYYMWEGKVYLRAGREFPDVDTLAGIYDALTVEADGVSVNCEDAREFEYLPGLWLPESAEVTFSLQAEDGAEIRSVTYNDGTEKALTPDENGVYRVTTGESAATLTVKTNAPETEPPADTDAGAAPNDTNAPAAGDDTAAVTAAETEKKSKPKKDKDTDEYDEGSDGCGSAMNVSAVVIAAVSAAAAFAVSKRRH